MQNEKLGLARHERRKLGSWTLCAAVCAAGLLWYVAPGPRVPPPPNAPELLAKCYALRVPAGPPLDFHSRAESDRHAPGTRATLIRNATIWTGENGGTQVVRGDLLLERGMIKAVGTVPTRLLTNIEYDVLDAHGLWITPGLVDLHSHLSVFSMPFSRGASGDFHSSDGPAVPWMRSIDGLNTHDLSLELSIAGGLTSALVLPGSGNAIGGQAFAMKLRRTAARTPSSMLIDSPLGQIVTPQNPPRWRHMKHACGENQLRFGSRLDSAWAFRSAYDEARQIRDAQDEFCAKVTDGHWGDIEGQKFPDSLKWEALVDVLRGRVKINTHCYEPVDFDQFVRLTNEFQFPLAAFHHSSEAYLVTDLLKQTWGGTPAVAIFATNGRYKREAYRSSEYAPKILSEAGISVVLKTDHPVVKSRDILFEAQQAFHFGLNESLALAAVTTAPAQATGLDYRIGFIKVGHDADIVLWDSHPLQVGATPRQVFIDGIPQLKNPHAIATTKPQQAPSPPNWDQEAAAVLEYQGTPPLAPRRAASVAFVNVGSEKTTVLVQDGRVVQSFSPGRIAETQVDLNGGEIVPGLITIGSKLGMEEIDFTHEASMSDGVIRDPLISGIAPILVDGLRFDTRHALIAYHSGVTIGVSAPISTGIIGGVSAAMRLGEPHGLADGAVIKESVALHYTIGAPAASVISPGFGTPLPSISTQIYALRRLLTDNVQGETGRLFRQAAGGNIPLVVSVTGADAMVALLRMKKQVERANGGEKLRMVFMQAGEAHIVAKEIAEAGVGVILSPLRPFPVTHDERRIQGDTLTTLLKHNITVGMGIREEWEAINTRFALKWALEDADGYLSSHDVLAIATTNLEKLLDLPGEEADFVAYAGGPWYSQNSKAVAVLSPSRGIVDLFV
ncbi:composite domain of metallo-dependent hydrolase [Auriculariales sp. MPI-PUGE-AT-0066]|nr:composite domain of metallo-dependent hydrolase [Auriculariales sp. MPI-PUGE-AT-0066]